MLDVLEFTSDRKRMSIVVKEVKSGKFLLLTKGADEAIFPRSCPGTWFISTKLPNIVFPLLYFKFSYTLACLHLLV